MVRRNLGEAISRGSIKWSVAEYLPMQDAELSSRPGGWARKQIPTSRKNNTWLVL
jgi:hypothetical protein